MYKVVYLCLAIIGIIGLLSFTQTPAFADVKVTSPWIVGGAGSNKSDSMTQYGYVAMIATNGATGASCPTTSYTATENSDTGSGSVRVQNPGSGSSAACQRGIFEFNTGEIPSDATITKVEFIFQIQGLSGSPLNCDITADTAHEPIASSAQTIWNDISAATVYVSNSADCVTNALYTEDLGSQARTDLQTLLNTNQNHLNSWFAVGMKLNDEGRTHPDHSFIVCTSTSNACVSTNHDVTVGLRVTFTTNHNTWLVDESTANLASTSKASGSTCPSPSTKTTSASATVQLPTSGDSTVNVCRRAAWEFSTASLTNVGTVNRLLLQSDFVSGSGNTRNCDITADTAHQPTAGGTTATQLWNDIGSGSVYFSNNAFCTTTIHWDWPLDTIAQAKTDFSSQVSIGWYAIGVKYNNETRDGTLHQTSMGGSTSTNYVRLVVEFTNASVTQPITCKLQESGATSETATLSGGSPSPATLSCTSGGTTTNITVNPSTTLTVTVATDGSNTRYRFNSSATSATTQNISTCSSGTCSTTVIYNYYELQNTYQASTNGQGPPTWDASLTASLTGTVAGAGSSTVGTLSPSSGTTTTASSAFWADYNTAVSYPTTLTGAGANIQWKLTGTSSFTDTTGGNTHSAVTYYKQLQNTYRAAPAGHRGTFDATMSITVTGTNLGTGSSTLATLTTSNGGGTQSTTQYADYNKAVSLTATPSVSSNEQWNGSGITFTDTTGGNTHTTNYYNQFKQTITPSGLDASKTLTATGKQTGLTSSPSLTGSASNAVWQDYGDTFTVPSTKSIASQERLQSYNSSSALSYNATTTNTKTFVYNHEYQLTSLTFQTNQTTTLDTQPTSFNFAMSNGTTITSISNTWVKNGTATISSVKWHTADITPPSNTLAITSGGAKTFKTAAAENSNPHMQWGGDTASSITNISYDTNAVALSFRITAPTNGAHAIYLEYPESVFDNVEQITANGTALPSGILFNNGLLSITGAPFNVYDFVIAMHLKDNSQNGGGGSTGGHGGGSGGGSPPPSPPPQTFTITAMIAPFNVAQGKSVTQTMLITIQGTTSVYLNHITFSNNSGWFTLGQTLPLFYTANSTTGMNIPISVTATPSQTAPATSLLTSQIDASNGVSFASLTIPITVNTQSTALTNTTIPQIIYNGTNQVGLPDLEIPGLPAQLSGPPLFSNVWNLMLLIIIAIIIAIIVRKATARHPTSFFKVRL